jgi:hypothetical protein
MTIDERGNGTTKYMLPVLSSIGGLLIGERADAAPALNLVAPREQWFSPPKEYCAKRSRCVCHTTVRLRHRQSLWSGLGLGGPAIHGIALRYS